MGLFNRIAAPVEGTAQVTSCSPCETDAPKAPCRMSLTVEGVGVPPFAPEKTLAVWTDAWPSAGDTLPVVFDLDHHDRIEIQWERMQPGYEAARAQAQTLKNAWDGAGTGLQAPAPVAPPDDGTSRVVQSTALVNNVWGQDDSSIAAPLELDLTVEVPGTGPVRLRRGFHSVRTKKWPLVGQTLPVTFPRGKPEKLKVDWGRVPKRTDGPVNQLRGAVDWLRGGDGGPIVPEGFPIMGPPPAVPAPAPATAPNVLDELDRLHERGVLSDAEFA